MRNTVIDHLKRPFDVPVLLNIKCRLLYDTVAYSIRRPVDQNKITNLHTPLITRFYFQCLSHWSCIFITFPKQQDSKWHRLLLHY